jgi:hypothetical protein
MGEKRSSVASTVPTRPLVPVDAELLAWRYQKPQSPLCRSVLTRGVLAPRKR